MSFPHRSASFIGFRKEGFPVASGNELEGWKTSFTGLGKLRVILYPSHSCNRRESLTGKDIDPNRPLSRLLGPSNSKRALDRIHIERPTRGSRSHEEGLQGGNTGNVNSLLSLRAFSSFLEWKGGNGMHAMFGLTIAMGKALSE